MQRSRPPLHVTFAHTANRYFCLVHLTAAETKIASCGKTGIQFMLYLYFPHANQTPHKPCKRSTPTNEAPAHAEHTHTTRPDSPTPSATRTYVAVHSWQIPRHTKHNVCYPALATPSCGGREQRHSLVLNLEKAGLPLSGRRRCNDARESLPRPA